MDTLSRWSARLIRRLAAYPYTTLLVVFFAGAMVSFVSRRTSEWDMVYVQAARHLWAGEDPYAQRIGYLYPPAMAFLAYPFTLVPQPISRLGWFLINAVCVVLMLRWAWRLSGGGRLEGADSADRREHVILLAGVACGVFYILNCLSHQQTDLLMAALLMGGCRALSQGRSYLSAGVLGLAAGIKCTPLLWAPYLLWRRRWGAAILLVAVAVGVNLLPNLAATPTAASTWLGEWYQENIARMTTAAYYPGQWGSDAIYNQSLAGAGYRWFAGTFEWRAGEFYVVPRPDRVPPEVLKGIVYGFAAVLGLVLLAVMGRAPTPDTDARAPARAVLEYCVVLLMMVLLSPMSSKPHFATLVLPGLCLARRAVRDRNRVVAVLLALAVAAALLSNSFLGDTIYRTALWYGSVTGCALLLLAGCGYCLYRDRRPADRTAPSTVDGACCRPS